MRRFPTWGWRLALIAALLLGPAALARAEGTSLYASPLKRFGFGVAGRYGDITQYDVGQLRAGWYTNWAYQAHPARPHGMEFVQTIYVGGATFAPNWAALGQAVDANPGAVWQIGNEPDTPGQDAMLPDEYARRYHEMYEFIKGRDPTARLSAPGIVQPTPLRLQWLDQAWQAHYALYGERMPVDIWNIHIQILQEDRYSWGCGVPPGSDVDQGQLYSVYDNASLDIFRQHIVDFRSWMRARGEREKPLVISEYGVLMPSAYLGGGDAAHGDQVVKDFMVGSFDYMLTAVDDELGCPADGNRLVQRWSWYSLNDKLIDLQTFVGYNGSLFDWRDTAYPGTITQFGQTYAAYTARFSGRQLYLPFLSRAP